MRRALLGSLLFLAAVTGCAEEAPDPRVADTLTTPTAEGCPSTYRRAGSARRRA